MVFNTLSAKTRIARPCLGPALGTVVPFSSAVSLAGIALGGVPGFQRADPRNGAADPF